MKLPCRIDLVPSWIAGSLVLASATAAQLGTVDSEQKISATAGGFEGVLGLGGHFGISVAPLGDLDGDGLADLAVGAAYDDDGGSGQGALWILFLKADGTVKAEQKISETSGGFGGVLDPNAHFGSSVARLGDLDGDGVVDLAVGADFDDELGTLWILFLKADGTVKAWRKIGEGLGGFGGDLDYGDSFGSAVAALGDLDGDGLTDLAVGAPNDDDGSSGTGAVWILFLNANGTVKDEQKISRTSGSFGGVLDQGDLFGWSVAPLGDLDGDGFVDLAVGAYLDETGSSQDGAVWILFLNADGTVDSEREIEEGTAGFGGDLDFNDRLGSSIASVGDLDGDGVVDLAVGADGDSDAGCCDRGAVWILFLNSDGTVRAERKINDVSGGFGGDIDSGDTFGGSIASLGDLDGDGVVDLAVGAFGDDDGGSSKGAVWILFLEGESTCVTLDFETEDDFVTPLVNGQHIDTEFGALVTLTSSGPNQGLAIFDSSVGGPNDPSQDRDLLVGTGNILILQTENYPPDANDVFPRPNDDEDGGTLSFRFGVAVEPQSLSLIDIDSGDGTSTVVLSDGSGRQRIYTVPRNWTGDRTLAQPGRGTLDLTTLLAQPGFGSSATANETPGFQAFDVVRLDVHMNGSGALDDLSVCFASQPRASVTVRNGAGENPSILATRSRPELGMTWRADLDCRAYGPGLAILVARRWPTSGVPSPYGEVLIGGDLLHSELRSYSGTVSPLSWNIPFDVALCGLEVHVQGLCLGSAMGPSRPKTLRMEARLSNALDLILGF